MCQILPQTGKTEVLKERFLSCKKKISEVRKNVMLAK